MDFIACLRERFPDVAQLTSKHNKSVEMVRCSLGWVSNHHQCAAEFLLQVLLPILDRPLVDHRNLFSFMAQDKRSCARCDYSTLGAQAVHYAVHTLPPPTHSGLSVAQMIAESFICRPNDIDIPQICPTCQGFLTTTQTMTTYPGVLVVIFKRVRTSRNGVAYKDRQPVVVTDVIKLPDDVVYSLRAGIVHNGSSVVTGHYMCYLYFVNGSAVCVSDADIIPCSNTKSVLQQDCVALFYFSSSVKSNVENEILNMSPPFKRKSVNVTFGD